jgi:agmatine/peptidylarginine deiminase
LTDTPAQSGFTMPAEWEEHEGTWLQWPHDGSHDGAQMRLEHVWLSGKRGMGDTDFHIDGAARFVDEATGWPTGG